MILEVKTNLKEFKVLGDHWSVNLIKKEDNDGKQFFQDDLFMPMGRDDEYLINSKVIVRTTTIPSRL